MSSLDTFLTYFGALCLALLFLYGLRNYLVTLIGGFISFCIFYFSYNSKDFEWNIQNILIQLKDAAIPYATGFLLAMIIYKILPLKPKQEAASK